MFLDEAYALAQGDAGPDSFSGEAVRTLLTEVENNRTGFLCILAGYQGPMQKLLKMDPGLPPTVHDQPAPRRLHAYLAGQDAELIASQNAGLSINLTERAARALAIRSVRASMGSDVAINLTELMPTDFGIEGAPAPIVRRTADSNF